MIRCLSFVGFAPLLAVVWLAASPAVGAEPAVGSSDRPEIEAVTKARYDLNLGFIVGGKVANVLVKPGDRVKAGDLLIELEDKEGLAQIEIWKFRSQSDVAVRAAEARLELAKLEEGRTRELVAKAAAAQFELIRAEIQSKVEGLNVEQARQDRDEARRQLAVFEARHEAYTLRAPIDGQVEDIIVSAGETVDDLKPVLRLVVTDPLWIDVATPTRQTLGIKINDPAWVRSTLTPDTAPLQGKVIHIAQVADAASDTRTVRIEVANSIDLPAGGQVTVGWVAPGAAGTAGRPDDAMTSARAERSTP